MTVYYDSTEQTYKDLPKAPYYVLSNDKFFSGWGNAAGKTNTCVVPCPDYETAERVEAYVRTRTEQNWIRINTCHPRNKDHVVYSLVLGWLDK